MEYHEIVNKYIERSGLSLGEIAKKMTEDGVKVDRSYLSKLKNNDTKNPASEEINRALAKATGGNEEELVKAAYIERAREPIMELLKKTGNLHLEELLKPVDVEKDVYAIRESGAAYNSNKNSDQALRPELELDSMLQIHLDKLNEHKLMYKGQELSEEQVVDISHLIELTLKTWLKKY